TGEGFWVDLDWHARLVAAARGAGLALLAVGGILAGDAIAATADAKARLHRDSGAIAIDLESHRVAVAAQRARVPFVILRAVADPAERDLPAAALAPLSRSGRPQALRIAASLARKPGQLAALRQLRRDAQAALAALEQGGRVLGDALRLPDGGSA